MNIMLFQRVKLILSVLCCVIVCSCSQPEEVFKPGLMTKGMKGTGYIVPTVPQDDETYCASPNKTIQVIEDQAVKDIL